MVDKAEKNGNWNLKHSVSPFLKEEILSFLGCLYIHLLLQCALIHNR